MSNRLVALVAAPLAAASAVVQGKHGGLRGRASKTVPASARFADTPGPRGPLHPLQTRLPRPAQPPAGQCPRQVLVSASKRFPSRGPSQPCCHSDCMTQITKILRCFSASFPLHKLFFNIISISRNSFCDQILISCASHVTR